MYSLGTVGGTVPRAEAKAELIAELRGVRISNSRKILKHVSSSVMLRSSQSSELPVVLHPRKLTMTIWNLIATFDIPFLQLWLPIFSTEKTGTIDGYDQDGATSFTVRLFQVCCAVLFTCLSTETPDCCLSATFLKGLCSRRHATPYVVVDLPRTGETSLSK